VHRVSIMCFVPLFIEAFTLHNWKLWLQKIRSYWVGPLPQL
jgi:hypothetical protein